MILSKHADTRCQQRGIKPQLLSMVVQFGEKSIVSGGANSYFLKNRDINYLISEYRQCDKKMIQTLDRLKGVQVIESQDGVIITAYHRRKR